MLYIIIAGLLAAGDTAAAQVCRLVYLFSPVVDVRHENTAALDYFVQRHDR